MFAGELVFYGERQRERKNRVRDEGENRLFVCEEDIFRSGENGRRLKQRGEIERR